MCTPCLPPVVQRLGPGFRLARHRHRTSYAAVVLAGSYVEAGLGGRVRAEAGTALIHTAFSGHLNEISATGAAVLNLPLPASMPLPRVFLINDPDALAKVAERSVSEALELLKPGADAAPLDDWPDRLARRLADPTPFRLSEWAIDHGLAPESVSRGFRKAFGTSPRRFLAETRAVRGVERLLEDPAPIAEIAFASGYVDQAHFTRAITALTGLTPARFRKVKSVQDTRMSDA